MYIYKCHPRKQYIKKNDSTIDGNDSKVKKKIRKIKNVVDH